jgi:hypothetical protein
LKGPSFERTAGFFYWKNRLRPARPGAFSDIGFVDRGYAPREKCVIFGRGAQPPALSRRYALAGVLV